MSPIAPAYIALGANLGDRVAALREAVRRMSELGTVSAVSSLYETDPVGYLDQPSFLNAVVALQTPLAPAGLMKELLAIETDAGRQRTFRNAPRTLDLDLLLYDDAIITSAGLTIPHPRLHERAFVLVPLAEIAPRVMHPSRHRDIAELLIALPSTAGVRRVPPPGWEITGQGGANSSEDH